MLQLLPNSDRARVDHEKVTEYLLSDSHPDGRAEAAFFKKFGFSMDRWEELAEMLIKHGMAHPVVKIVRSGYGTRYCVDGPVETPSGIRPSIRTVWIIEEGSSEPRLITAYPV